MEHPTSWQGDMLEKLGGFEAVVIEPVYAELGRLADGGGRASRFASLAKGLTDSGALKLEMTGGRRADEELVSRALGENALVATIDSALMEQLGASRIGVVTLRNGRVELKGVIS
jgi:rRNA-processing protein FCF1